MRFVHGSSRGRAVLIHLACRWWPYELNIAAEIVEILSLYPFVRDDLSAGATAM